MQVQLEQQHRSRRMAPPTADAIERRFEAFIDRAAFPCLGAKASRARHQLQLVRADDITCARDDAAIVQQLQAMAETDSGQLFVSVAVLFADSPPLGEADFQAALWRRLQAIHALDRRRHDWDARVSDDPASPHFSMSVGGKAFYVVGMHPRASRPARRFECATLVFNLHSQFEQLRADGRYGKLRAAILQRDVAFAGSVNPMLAVHGKASEARQYSGRDVGDNWTCPFHSMSGDKRA